MIKFIVEYSSFDISKASIVTKNKTCYFYIPSPFLGGEAENFSVQVSVTM